MKALKAFFLSRLMREKALLLAFVGIFAAIWLSNFTGRASAFTRSFRQTTSDLDQQQKVLDSRQSTEAAAKKAIAQFDPAKTYNLSNLIAAVNQLATAADLDTLPGIGPTTAQAIVDYRLQNGSFQSVQDLQNVPGIGPATFANIKDYITIGS